MSLTDLLPERLNWHNGSGRAVHQGRGVDLCSPPVVGFQYVELDYAPGACAIVRRRPCDALADMTGDEIEACRRWLAAADRKPCAGSS